MARARLLVVRVNEVEHRAIDDLARHERLPVSTMMRRLTLKEADVRLGNARRAADAATRDDETQQAAAQTR